jgi:hypothetical protein
MAGLVWLDEEKAIVMYLASIGIGPQLISDLLLQRGFRRTPSGIRSQIFRLCKAEKIAASSINLEPYRVDKWIDRLSKNRIGIESFLQPTEQDQRCVDQVLFVLPKRNCFLR